MSWRYSVDEIAEMCGIGAPGSSVEISRVCTDTRKLQQGDLFVALKGENFDANEMLEEAFSKGAAAAIANRASSAGPCLITNDPLQTLQRFAARHRQRFSMPVFAVTGSCGKTSTKDFVSALLRTKYNVVKTQGNLNNEIGCPLSLLQLDEDTDFAVIEMGANHVGEIAHLCRLARPTESAITMVGPAHLEGFGSIERVAAAKSEIASGLGANGIFYVNTDDPWCVGVGEQYRGEKIYFGRVGDVRLLGSSYDSEGLLHLEIDPIGKLVLPLPILAQSTNVLAAVAVALQHGVTEFEEPLSEACKASSRFKIEEVAGLYVLDDSYNANPSSMKASIQALGQRKNAARKLAALGSMLELGEKAEAMHEEVGACAGANGITHVFARGDHAYAIIRGARAAGVAIAEAIDDHAAMAEAILAVARPGDALLVKGSRGMRMEGVLSALRERAQAPAADSSPREVSA